MRPLHTTNRRKAEKIWSMLGGSLQSVRRTGEVRYSHPSFSGVLRLNGRRNDVPAVLLSRINQLLKQAASNDPVWNQVG